jgi:ABC-type dipeptide/oligopeptide/nickel transport system permease subunit
VAGLVVVAVVVAIAVVPQEFAGWFGHGNPRQCDLADSGLGPSAGHPFGTDIQGCDLYANVIFGARASVTIALLTTAGTLLLGIVAGGLAGYLGGWADAVISRIMDVFLGFPALVGMIVILQVLSVHNVFSVSAVLTLFGWPGLARVVRGSALAAATSDYVAAVRGLGMGTGRVLLRHVLPNSVGPALALAGTNVGGIIAAESALTFLGVGLQTPAISWGVELNTAQQFFPAHLNLIIFPSIFLTATVLGFVLLADALRDAGDPMMG